MEKSLRNTGLDDSDFEYRQGGKKFLSPKRTEMLWGPKGLLFTG